MTSFDINPETSIAHLQQTFTKRFPFLKIEFFYKPNDEKNGSMKKDLITDHSIKIGELTTAAMDMVIVLHPNMSVGELEELFETRLHLHVQVFHKSGKIWLETVRTDAISLQELNKKAQRKSEQVLEQESPADYHEQE